MTPNQISYSDKAVEASFTSQCFSLETLRFLFCMLGIKP